MKSLIFLIVLIVATGFVFGLCLGWFHVASDSADGKTDITLTVDKDKIQQDKDKAVAAVQDLGQHARDRTGATTQKSQGETAAGAQSSPGRQ